MAVFALRDNALTTLARFKAMTPGFNQEDTSIDDLLTQLINEASAYVETALARKLKKADCTEQAKGTGNQVLLTKNYPIRAVAYIQQAGVTLDPASYDWQQDGAGGIIYKDDGWTYHGYPYGLVGDPVAGSRNIEIKYTAGYVLPKDATPEEPADLPADLEGLVASMIQFTYGRMKSGGNAGLKSFAIADVRWEWASEGPASWQETIDRYKRGWL